MKRIVSSFVATVIGLIALLSFKTHTPEIDTAAATSADDGSSADLSTAAPSTSSTSVAGGASGTTASTSPSTAKASSSTTQKTASTTTTSTTKAPSKSTAATTITGSEVDTRWGPVQVKITVKGSKVTAVDVVEYPSDNPRDVAINSTAVPQLVSQALQAQSADIAGVSGATVTTGGFKSSLQSALAKI